MSLPGANTENSQEEEKLFDVRFSQKNNFLGYKQDMPQRSITVRQTMAQVKKSLGHRARTHYKTMLSKPSTKLQPFIFPGMNVEQLKFLTKVLSTTNPKQRTQLKKEASEKRRIHALAEERKRKEALAVKRQEAVTIRNQLAQDRQENTFLQGLAEEVQYNFTDEHDFQKMLDRFLPRLQAGERFLINVGETWFTLSLAKYEELTKIIETVVELREEEEVASDGQLIAVVVKSIVTVERPRLRLGRDFEFANGEFFPYIPRPA